MKTIKLCCLPMDCPATVSSLEFRGSERRRIMDLGLCEGSDIKPILKSPFGGPVAYLICGALIALRGCDAARVTVCPAGKNRGCSL